MIEGATLDSRSLADSLSKTFNDILRSPVAEHSSEQVAQLRLQAQEILKETAVTGLIPRGSSWNDVKILLGVLMQHTCLAFKKKFGDDNKEKQSNSQEVGFTETMMNLFELLNSFEKELPHQSALHDPETLRADSFPRKVVQIFQQVGVRAGEG